MVEYYNQVVQAVKDYPMVVAAVSNFVLAIVFFLSFYQKLTIYNKRNIRIQKRKN